MKFNKIAVASFAVLAGTSFAAGVECISGPNATPEKFVQTCAPTMVFYVAGSSALGGAVDKVITSTVTTAKGYFDVSSTPFVATIIDTGTPNGTLPNTTNGGKAGMGGTAYFGMSKAALTGGTSVPLLIVYNSYMGSAAGVSNLLADSKLLTASNVPEADIVKVGPITAATKGATPTLNSSCRVATTADATPAGSASAKTDFVVITVANGAISGTSKVSSGATNLIACSTHAVTRADIALSDVDATELVGLYDKAIKGGMAKFSTALANIKRTNIAMQGFGVAVNNNFYGALQAAQGLNTDSCAPTTTTTVGSVTGTVTTTTTTSVSYAYTEACQPSISRAQYASLVTTEGSIKSTAGFIAGDNTMLTLARRDQLSGTQATSNMFFASEGCNALDAKSKINTHGGALTVLRSPGPNTLTVTEAVQTGDVETALKATTGYSIGVLALSKAGWSNKDKYKFVKLDGASPNFAKGGTAPYGVQDKDNPNDGAVRTNMLDGSWPLQVASYAMTAATVPATKQAIVTQMINDLSDSTLHDLPAIGYFNGSATKQTKVSRVLGNNCSPLITRNN